MANFTTISLAPNTGTNASPIWTNVLGGANTETRWSDVGTGLLATASASWPAMIRPAATQLVTYTYAYTADAVGLGYIGNTGNPVAFDDANYLFARWAWDAVGTFASAPIFTAFPTTAHGAVSAGDGSLLGGHATDTGSRSYMKGNAYGRVTSAGAPAATPAADAVVTSGSVGSLGPTAGANWMALYQSLQGDNDYITAPFTPAATTADTWNILFTLFTGPNMTPSTYTVQLTLKFTWT